MFTSLITCDALVHENDDPKGDDRYAAMGFGVPEPSLVVAGDLTATAEKVLSRLRAGLVTNQTTKVAKLQSQVVDVGGSQPAQSVSGNVTYRLPGLSSTDDRLVVVVRWQAEMSRWPTPSDRTTCPHPPWAASMSLGSLTARR